MKLLTVPQRTTTVDNLNKILDKAVTVEVTLRELLVYAGVLNSFDKDFNTLLSIREYLKQANGHDFANAIGVSDEALKDIMPQYRQSNMLDPIKISSHYLYNVWNDVDNILEAHGVIENDDGETNLQY